MSAPLVGPAHAATDTIATLPPAPAAPDQTTSEPVAIAHTITFVLTLLLGGLNGVVWTLAPSAVAELTTTGSVFIQAAVTFGFAIYTRGRVKAL